MLIKDIVARINRKLSGERVSYADLQIHMDAVIDEINTDLNTIFPAFSELDLSVMDYNMFPDRYIRMVVVPGAAAKFYATDEEGIAVAPAYETEYMNNRFLMIRDYFSQVPAIYRNNDGSQGTVTYSAEDATGNRGVEVDGSYFHN